MQLPYYLTGLLALVILIGCDSSSHVTSPKFEYCELRVDEYGAYRFCGETVGHHGSDYEDFVEDFEVTEPIENSIRHYEIAMLNHLGKLRWELVSTSRTPKYSETDAGGSTSYEYVTRYVLCRPLE